MTRTGQCRKEVRPPRWMRTYLADTAQLEGLRSDGVTVELPLGLARVVEHRADHDQAVRVNSPGSVPAHPHTEVPAVVRVALQVAGETPADPFRVPRRDCDAVDLSPPQADGHQPFFAEVLP